MLPSTVDELVRAHVLLGEPEDKARALWTGAVTHGLEQRDSGAESWGIGLAEGTLLALSLLSDDMAARVQRYRRAAWNQNYPLWQRVLAPEELRRREEEDRCTEAAWHRDRERLRRVLFGTDPPT